MLPAGRAFPVFGEAMTGPNGETGDPNDPVVRQPPEELQRNPSLWDSILLATFGGATKAEQAALQQSMNKGFVDPNVSRRERLKAREDAIRGLNYFGVQFDWDAWRREMGYSA